MELKRKDPDAKKPLKAGVVVSIYKPSNVMYPGKVERDFVYWIGFPGNGVTTRRWRYTLGSLRRLGYLFHHFLRYYTLDIHWFTPTIDEREVGLSDKHKT